MTGKEAERIHDLVGQKNRLGMYLTKLKEDIENKNYDKADHYGCPESVPMIALETELEKVMGSIESFKTKP